MSRIAFALSIGVLGLAFSATGFAMRPMEFLEKYDLGELTYIGMHSRECDGKRSIEATVIDPEGLPHRVRLGNYVGRDFGMVMKITEEHIEVSEVIENAAGEWIERQAFMPKVLGGARPRAGYEESHALEMLGKIDDSGRRLKERLIECGKFLGEDEKRLACFDKALGLPF